MILKSAASEFLLLSVRPKFAEAIVDGRKTIDIRRQRPNVQPGTLGLVYSSSPIQAVVGSFRVDSIFSGTLEELWFLAERGAYLSKEDFDDYFEGVGFGHAIVVSCGQRLTNPIKLSNLRDIWPGCNPPRSFGYIVPADAFSRRIMSAFRERLFNEGKPSEDVKPISIDTNIPLDHKGLFLLKGEEVRALISLLGSEGQ